MIIQKIRYIILKSDDVVVTEYLEKPTVCLSDRQLFSPTQQNSYCSHCAVTGQWRCGDYPLIY